MPHSTHRRLCTAAPPSPLTHSTPLVQTPPATHSPTHPSPPPPHPPSQPRPRLSPDDPTPPRTWRGVVVGVPGGIIVKGTRMSETEQELEMLGSTVQVREWEMGGGGVGTWGVGEW